MDYRTRIRNVREDRDYTQACIGKILQKSQQGYNHIEAGRAELKIDDLIRLCCFYDLSAVIRLCCFYDLSADYMIGLIDDPVSYRR